MTSELSWRQIIARIFRVICRLLDFQWQKNWSLRVINRCILCDAVVAWHVAPGWFPLKRVTGMCGGKDPHFTLPQLLHKTPFQHFFCSSTRPYFNQKSRISQFSVQNAAVVILANFQFVILKINQNPVQEASMIWAKILFGFLEIDLTYGPGTRGPGSYAPRPYMALDHL